MRYRTYFVRILEKNFRKKKLLIAFLKKASLKINVVLINMRTGGNLIKSIRRIKKKNDRYFLVIK